MPEPAPEAYRFIPFRRSDLLRMLHGAGLLGGPAQARFDAGVDIIDEAFAREFHTLRHEFKDRYAPFDPDADTRMPIPGGNVDGDAPAMLAEQLGELLNRGNYEQLGAGDLRRAFRSASLFQVRLRVDLADFDDVLLYCRGASRREETLPVLFGLFRRHVRFVNYDRVVLYLRFADRGQGADSEYPPGRVMIKLFQNVPDADLEMLFPNMRVAMRWSDRLLIGVPALASGAVVAFTKLGAPLVLLAGLFGYWLGMRTEPVALDRGGLLILAAGFGALGAYLWKQWSSYRNRKARFRQALTRNLYFKLLDNNAGVLLRVLDDAEESECKEAMLALYFLLAAEVPLTAAELDDAVETWLEEHWGARLDFEIADALGKLERLGLAARDDERWRALAQGAAAAAP